MGMGSRYLQLKKRSVIGEPIGTVLLNPVREQQVEKRAE